MAGVEVQDDVQRGGAAPGTGVTAAAPPHVHGAGAAGPYTVVTMHVGQCLVAVSGAGFEAHGDRRGVFDGVDPAQQDGVGGVAGEGQRFAAFDDSGVGDPAAAPDHRPFFVVAAPDVATRRGDRVLAGPADQGGEHRVAVPARRAHPDDFAPRSDDGSAFPVGQQGVLPQHFRREVPVGLGRSPTVTVRVPVSTAPTTADAVALAALISAARR